MNRKQILSEYEVRDGIIQDCGKFECCAIYAPYFYEHADDGEVLAYMEEGTGTYASLISISKDDLIEFPELKGYEFVLLEENDIGFVTATPMGRWDAEQTRKDYEAELAD